MLVHADGRVAGSVSGGCVEGAVVNEAMEVLSGGRGHLFSVGYSNDEAFAVGLSCGGTIELFVAPGPPPHTDELAAELQAGRPAALSTVVAVGAEAEAHGVAPGATLLLRDDGACLGGLGDRDLDAAVLADTEAALRSGRSICVSYGPTGERCPGGIEVFIESFNRPARLVIFGAVDFSAALASLGKLLGYQVTVCDARATFATRARFPMADEVVVDWPQRYLAAEGASLGADDACCVLTHDVKFDVPAIVAALATKVGYIGVMGSRRTNAERFARLRAEGLGESDLDRLRAPIGLDIGARTPEETAVSIMAEVIAQRSGAAGGPLRSTAGPIHRRREVTAER